jgi:hypothetical protein
MEMVLALRNVGGSDEANSTKGIGIEDWRRLG